MSEVKYRNMIMQVFLMIVTFGIYVFYWFYQTCAELKTVAKDADAAPTLWTVLLIFPPLSIISFYKHSELYEKVCSEKLNKWVIFLLWLVFPPAVWFLVQNDLNKIAQKPLQSLSSTT